MTAILKVDEIQDTSGNLIIKEDSNTITLGASGDTIALAGTTVTGITQGITVADQFRVNAGITFSSEQVVNTNWERIDTSGQGTLGSGMTESSGIFTFPSTGIYLVRFVCTAFKDGDTRYIINSVAVTTDNSSYTTVASGYDSITRAESSSTYMNSTAESLIDVTDTSNVKVRFLIRASAESTLSTSSSINRNTATFIRLGDT